MSHLTNAQNVYLNKAIRDAVRRDLTMEWRRRPGEPWWKELVSVYTKENGAVRTRILYCTDSPYGAISARSITNQVRELGGRITDPEPVFQDQEAKDVYL